MRLIHGLLCILFVLSSFGCKSMSEIVKEPKVSLASLKVQDPTSDGATLVFGLLVDNPNPIALTVDRLTYDLEVSGRALTSGELKEGASVASKSSAVVSVPIAVKYKDLFSTISQFLKDQKSPYRLKGAAKIGPFQIPFDQTGELVFPKKKLF